MIYDRRETRRKEKARRMGHTPQALVFLPIDWYTNVRQPNEELDARHCKSGESGTAGPGTAGSDALRLHRRRRRRRMDVGRKPRRVVAPPAAATNASRCRQSLARHYGSGTRVSFPVLVPPMGFHGLCHLDAEATAPRHERGRRSSCAARCRTAVSRRSPNRRMRNAVVCSCLPRPIDHARVVERGARAGVRSV